jgi:transposase
MPKSTPDVITHFPRGDWPFPFSRDEWDQLPPAVHAYLFAQHRQTELLRTRVAQLEAKLNENSQNSSRPPSSDSPYKKRKPDQKKGNTGAQRGAKKGHPGHRRTRLEPTDVITVPPKACPCGCREFPATQVAHTHQTVEIPDIPLTVTDFQVLQGRCPRCGTLCKGEIPAEHRTGFGSRLTAFVCELSGTYGTSRRDVQSLVRSFLRLPISLGAIQKMIDRGSEAIEPHYDAIGQIARSSQVNYIDETPWYLRGELQWLWVMTNPKVAYYKILPKRSKAAFETLIDHWCGILVSDGYGVYVTWDNLRQRCVAHLIRKARKLSEHNDPEVARFRQRVKTELQRLCRMTHETPTGQWRALYMRLFSLLDRHKQARDGPGKLAREILKRMDQLWVFLETKGLVEPTNNRAERALRFLVCYRKRSQGTESDKGNRWVERIGSLRETCRLRGHRTYDVLVDAIRSRFEGRTPDLSWLPAA